jgi:FkbM family methyltransferase
MEKIIHFVTVKYARDLSAEQVDVIERARRLHGSWKIKVWSDPDLTRDNDRFLLSRYWSRANSGAQLADLLRLDIVYRYGGVYVDSDLKLLKPLDDLIASFEFFIGTEDGYHLSSGVFGACKQSPVVRHLIDELLRAEPDWTLPPNATTGPVFFSQNLKWRRDITVLPRESFYPYSDFANEQDQKTHRQSHGEHLWAGSWYKAPNIRRSKGPFIRKKLKQAAVSAFNVWRRIQPFDARYLPKLAPLYQCCDELAVQTIHGFSIIVDGRDLSFTPQLVFNGFYELHEENFLKRTVKGGDWVIDVGANVGSFSLLAAQLVGPFGRVFAFEPNPHPARLMAKSVVMNWVHDRVIQRTVAVGNRHGTVTLTFMPALLGMGQLSEGVSGSTFVECMRTLGKEGATALNVSCVRLDEEFPVDLPIKLLKIDVEGFEADVLAGADRLLQRRCIDFILLEFSKEICGRRWHETVQQVTKAIKYGYHVFTLNQDKLVAHRDLAEVIGMEHRNPNIVLAAQEQYRAVVRPAE